MPIASLIAAIFLAALSPATAGATDPVQTGCQQSQGKILRQQEDIGGLRLLIAQRAARDIASLCKEDRLRDSSTVLQLQGKGSIYKQVEELLDRGDVRGAEALLGKHASFSDPWRASLSGSASIKSKGIIQSSVLENQWGFKSAAEVRGYLEKRDEKAARQPQFTRYEKKSILPKGRDLMLDWLSGGVCSEITKQAKECSENLKRFAVELETYETQFVSGHQASITPILTVKELHDRVLRESRYQEGIRRAALKILDRGSDLTGTANLFDDVKAGFIDAKLDPEQAENLTWDIMAVLAASGPNLGQRLWTYETQPVNNTTRVALTAIAESIPLYDSLKLESLRTHYSLPPGVKSSCDSGKSYHFWMTAYLARKTIQSGGAPSAAASSAFITNVAYQALAGGEGWRKPQYVFIRERFSPMENSVRMDLSLAAAGAKFGAFKTATNVDKVYLHAVAETTTEDSLNVFSGTAILLNPVAARARWERIYTPWSIFKNAAN